MTDTADIIGAIDFAVIEFPGNKFNGEVAPALFDLIAEGTVRIIDLAFIVKDEAGEVVAVEIEDLDEEQIGALGVLAPLFIDIISDEDIANAAEVLVPNSSALLIVWENAWMVPLARAIRGSGGDLVASGRIPATEMLEALEAIEASDA